MNDPPISLVRQVSMKTVLQRSTFGIVLTLEGLSNGSDKPPLSAHLILNRRLIDDDGYMCLAASTGFHAVLDIIEALKSELDSLANETVLWLAQNIVSHRARFSVISNDGFNALGGEKGGGGYASGGNPPPNRFSTSSASWPIIPHR